MKSPFYASLGTALVLCAHLQVQAQAQGLQPDPAFGTNGQVLTPLGTTPASNAQLLDLVALPNNQLLVLAQGSTGLVTLRYRANGSLDTSHGTGGQLALAPLPAGFTPGVTQSFNSLHQIVLQPDGRVYLSGTAGTPTSYALVAYLANGALDTGFGSGGMVTINQAAGTFAVQPDGKVLVGGSAPVQTQVGSFTGGEMTITRLRANGTPEFSTQLTHTVLAPATAPGARAITWAPELQVQPDGKILAIGRAERRFPLQLNLVAMARLLPDGTPDASFGANGTLLHNLDGRLSTFAGYGGNSVVSAAGGKFIVNLTERQAGGANSVPARFLANGQLDLAYGQNGLAMFAWNDGPCLGNALAVQPDGKLLLGGSCTAMNLNRFTPDGLLDRTVVPAASPTTYLMTGFGPLASINDSDGLTKIVIVAPNQVVLGGTSRRVNASATRPSGSMLALARFTEAGTVAATRSAGPLAGAYLYPNPLSGESVAVRVAGLPGAVPVVVTLYNALGQALYTRNLKTNQGIANTTLSVAGLSAGAYLVRLSTGTWAHSLRLVKE